MTFHGIDVASSEIDGIRYRTRRFSPFFSTDPHSHDEPYFCLVLGGPSRQVSARHERERQRGSVFFYPAGEVQSERFGAEGGYLFGVGITPAAKQRFKGLDRPSFELLGLARSLAVQLYVETKSAGGLWPLAAETLTDSLVAEVAGERTGCSKRWLSAARDFLHAHFAENLRLARIAAAVGVHPVHLSSEFPRHFGATITQYVRRLRIDFAQRRLAATDEPIAEIALEAGFADQAHFGNHFKAATRLTPGRYRAVFRGA